MRRTILLTPSLNERGLLPVGIGLQNMADTPDESESSRGQLLTSTGLHAMRHKVATKLP